jgi:hypothetical protein
MPPLAPTGRPALYCSLTCRRDNEYAVARRRWEERERRERPKREAEWKAQREAQEAARLEAEEAERQRNLAAGGLVALDQMQRDAFYADRCGWYEDDDDPADGVCQRPTDESFVWCKKHNCQVDRESAARRRRKETEAARQSRAST